MDILTLSAEGGDDGACFSATVHWCAVTHERIVVGGWLAWGLWWGNHSQDKLFLFPDNGNSTTVARNVNLHPLIIE